MLKKLGEAARTDSRFLATATAEQKNDALCAIAQALRTHCADILAANDLDVANARAQGISEGLIDRLTLTEKRVQDISDAVLHITTLEDPIGRVDERFVRPNGLEISKVRVPLGVIGIIYEARPNVTVDAAALCLKSGNAVILRGGKEAMHSNCALVDVMRSALLQVGFPENCISLITDTDREIANQFMKLNQYLDVLIPRGGAGLIQAVIKNATVPVIETGVGNCHVYVDDAADLDMGVRIIDNAKTSRPSVCNAAETLLVHRRIADTFLPLAYQQLSIKGVTIKGCETTLKILGNQIIPATEEDYATEFLNLTLAVRVVDSLEQAVEHITRYSTKHSECIVTQDKEHARFFTENVDAAAVYVNASTRFTDGGEFGLGAEIGISTQKLHARGPMGLEALTSIKYVIQGQGQVR